MFVLVSGDNGGARASVEDPGNLRQLHAEFRGVRDDAAAAALAAASLGTVDGDHAWLDVSALRRAGDGSPDWASGFDGMLAYAAGQGWTSADGTRVRAHIVRSLSRLAPAAAAPATAAPPGPGRPLPPRPRPPAPTGRACPDGPERTGLSGRA